MLTASIRTFLAVADSGSFSAASARLYVSKVSVMNQINSLEAQLGVPLFLRSHQGVALTEAGTVFYRHAQDLTRRADEAIRQTRSAGGVKSKTIRVGTSMMRPCASLVELWEGLDDGGDYQFSIVPFHDGPHNLDAMLAALGDTIDCFVTPCGSTQLLENYGFLPFRACKCAVALSKKHPLAKRDRLTWQDLAGESLLLMKKGESYVLDELREDILRNHPTIRLVDFDGFYDLSTFNLCEQQGYLMETLDIWERLHPALATLPVDWPYEIPYGVLYAREPSDLVKDFIHRIAAAISPE